MFNAWQLDDCRKHLRCSKLSSMLRTMIVNWTWFAGSCQDLRLQAFTWSSTSAAAASSQSSLELDQSCCHSDPDEPDASGSVLAARASAEGATRLRLGAGAIAGCLTRLPAMGATFSLRLFVLLIYSHGLAKPTEGLSRPALASAAQSN